MHRRCFMWNCGAKSPWSPWAGDDEILPKQKCCVPAPRVTWLKENSEFSSKMCLLYWTLPGEPTPERVNQPRLCQVLEKQMRDVLAVLKLFFGLNILKNHSGAFACFGGGVLSVFLTHSFVSQLHSLHPLKTNSFLGAKTLSSVCYQRGLLKPL